MAIRKDIVWTVGENLSVHPTAPQEGGVQGESNAVRVKFNLGAQHPLVTGGYQLYIECEDPTGAYDKTEPLPVKDGAIVADVPLAWTQYGGTVKLNVVAEKEEERIESGVATMVFRNRNGKTKKMQALIQTLIQKLLDTASDLLGQAEDVLDRAKVEASNASQSAHTAGINATAAANSAADAAASAESAEESANTAMAMCNESRVYKTTAEAAAQNAAAAQQSAEEAKEGAVSARKQSAQYASQCLGASSDAVNAKNAAKAAADAASQSAEAAATAGNTAAESAQDATAAASAAANAAVAASQSASDAAAAAEEAKKAADGILVVQYDERQGTSHSYQEVYDHITGGGVAVLEEHGRYYNFSMRNGAGSLFFIGVDDERVLHGYEFYDGGVIKFEPTHIVNDEYVQDYVAEQLEQVGGGITIDDVKPFRFTVTRDGKKYRSSATYEEIKEVIDAGNRIVICEFDDLELTFAGANALGDFTFYTYYLGYRIAIIVAYADVVNVERDTTPVTTINVLDFEAVGDGVTDDTDAIQDALYAAEESGLPLYFPSGTYLVSSTITTHTRDTDEDMQSNNLHIYGDGFGSVIKTTEDFDGDYVFYVDIKNAQPRSLWVHDFAIELYADVSGIYFHEIGMKSVVENLWITYLYDEKPSSVRAGIYCRMSTVTTFQRIKVFGINRTSKGHENIGIVCAASYSTKFVDCDVIFCKWAIYLSGGSNNCIERCRIDENEYGVYQNSSGGAYMDDTRAYPRDGKTFQGTFRNLTIRGNRFENNNKQAIFLSSYGDGALGYLRNAQITIADNDFSGLGLGKAFQSAVRKVFRKAIHLRNCRGIVIENNAFSGMPYEDDTIDAFGRYVAEASDEVIADAKARKSTQNIEGSNVDDITIQGNVTVAKPATVKVAPGKYEHIKDEDGNEIYFKTNSHLNTDILDATGFADNIEDDQSTRHNLGDVSVALDRIIAIQNSLIGGSAAMITFVMGDDQEYQAEEGMTWAEWCDSKYNTCGCTYDDRGVYDNNGDAMYEVDLVEGGPGYDLRPTVVIVDGGVYYAR